MENTIVSRGFDRYGVFEQMKKYPLMIVEESKGRGVAVGSKELVESVSSFEPIFAGLEIGTLTKQFTPTLQGADLFAREGGKGKHYVTVNCEAEKLVLYGRDVFGKSILDASLQLEQNELVIIINRHRDAIGIGRTRYSGEHLKRSDSVTISTISDMGYYLRGQGN